MFFVNLMGLICLICGELNGNVLETNLFSYGKLMSNQITLLITNSTVNSIRVFGIEDDCQAKDILEDILNNLSPKPSIFLGKSQKQESKMDILLYFMRNIDKVSKHNF